MKTKNLKKIQKKMLTAVLESFDTFLIFATTSTSVTLSVTNIALTVDQLSSGVACGLPISNKIIYEIVMQKYNKVKKPFQRAQETISSFDKLYREGLLDIVVDLKK